MNSRELRAERCSQSSLFRHGAAPTGERRQGRGRARLLAAESKRRRRAEPQRFHHRERPHGQQSSSQEFPLASHLRRCRYGRRGTPAPLRVSSLVVKSWRAQPEALPSISQVRPASRTSLPPRCPADSRHRSHWPHQFHGPPGRRASDSPPFRAREQVHSAQPADGECVRPCVSRTRSDVLRDACRAATACRSAGRHDARTVHVGSDDLSSDAWRGERNAAVDDLEGDGRARPDRGRARDLPPPRRLDRPARRRAERAGQRSPRRRPPGQAPEADRPRRAVDRARVVRARARPPHHLGRAARRRRARLRSVARGAPAAVGRRDHRRGQRSAVARARHARPRRRGGRRLRRGLDRHDRAPPARRDRDRRRAAPARARRRVHRRRQRADPAGRRARHRGRDRRVRDAAVGAARVGIGDRAAPAGGRRGRAARCSTRPTAASRTSASADRRTGARRARRCPIVDGRGAARLSSCRSASAEPTASRSRRASGRGRSASSASTCGGSPARSKTPAGPTTSCCPGSRSTPPTGERRRRIDDADVAAALDGADLVIVDNLCSLPLNVDAARAVARVAAAHHGRVLFRHHDLPWQRRHLAHLGAELPPRVDGALHATINLRSRRELEARGYRGRDHDPQLLRSRSRARRPRRDARAVRLRRRRAS